MFTIGDKSYNIDKYGHIINNSNQTGVIYTKNGKLKNIKTSYMNNTLTFDSNFIKLYLEWEKNVSNHNLKCAKSYYMMYHNWKHCDLFDFDERNIYYYYNDNLDDLVLYWIRDINVSHIMEYKLDYSPFISNEKFSSLYALTKFYH